MLLDNWTQLNPETELASLPRESIMQAVIVDANGHEVADQLLDPIRELGTPQEERYAVVLKRHDTSGELPFTGLPIWIPILLAAALLASGGLLLRRKRDDVS